MSTTNNTSPNNASDSTTREILNDIKSYKVSGFDLIVTTSDGTTTTLKDGLTNLVLGKVELRNTAGQTISQDAIISTIQSQQLGLDTVYLRDKLEGMTSDDAPDDNKNEPQEISPEQDEVLKADLQKKIEEYKELIKKQEQLVKQQENERLKEINESADKKEVVDKQVTRELSKQLKPNEIEVPDASASVPTPQAPPVSSSSSSDSSSGQPEEIIAPPKQDPLLFIDGKLDEKSDSGRVGDNLTNVNTPTFIGRATPGTTASLTINAVSYPLTIDQDGNWLQQVTPALPDGNHEVTFTITNRAGESVTTTTHVTIDTQLTGLSADLDAATDSGVLGDTITNNPKPIISGTSEPDSVITVTINAMTLTTVADKEGNWFVSPGTNLNDGTYDYVVTASDEAGNTATVNKTFTIDASAPDATFTLSAASDSGMQGDFLTNNTQPTLTGKTEPGANVTLTLNSKVYQITADQQGVWALTVSPPLADGSHNFTIKVDDIAGNSASKSGYLIIDTQLPTVTAALSAATDSGDSDTDNITNDPHPVLTGSTKPFSVVTITIAGNHYSVQADDSGAWSWQIPDDLVLGDGSHNYALSVTDVAGNASATPFTGAFTLVTTPPSAPSVNLDLSSNSGDPTDTITNVKTPTLTGTSDPYTDVFVAINGQTYAVKADDQGQWQLTLSSPLPDGDYPVSVTAKDIAGNLSQVSGNMTLVIDTSVPEVSASLLTADDTGRADNDGITNVTRPRFHGSATPNTTVIFTIDNTDHRVSVGADGQWSLTLPNALADETYVYSVKVENAAGTSSTITGSLTIDTTLPSSAAGLNTASDSGQSSVDGITNVTRPPLTGTSEPGSTIVVTFQGTSHNLNSDADGVWSLTLPTSLAQGDYTYTVTATDQAGNTSTSQHQFTVDTVSQLNGGLDLSSVMEGTTGGNVTNLVRPTLSGMAEPGSIVKVEIHNAVYTASVNDDGRWSLELPRDASAGINPYTVTAEDVAGNKTTISGNFTYISSGATPPKVSVQLDTASDSGTQGDSITNINTPTFIGRATPGTTILLTIAGNSYTTTAAANDGAWSIRVDRPLPEGLNTYEVIATDESSSLSTAVNNNVFIDTLPPVTTVELTDATDSGIKGDMITQTVRPVFRGNTEPGATVFLRIDGQNHTVTADANGNWSIQAPTWGLPPNYTADYRIQVTDQAGNSTTTTGRLTTDNTAPTLTPAELDSASDTGDRDRYDTNQLTPTITGRAEPGTRLIIRINGQDYRITDVAADGTWKFKLPAGIVADNGNYHTVNFTVTATDAAGNATSRADQIHIAKRQLTITSGLSENTDTDTKGDNLTSVHAPTLTGTISGGQAADNLRGTITIAGKTYPLTINADGTEWSFRVPSSAPLTSGEHNYTVTFVDKFGTETSHTATVTISTLAGYLSPADDTGTVGDNLTQNSAPTLSGKAAIGSTLRIEFNGQTHSIPVTPNGTWTFRLPGGPFIDGDYTYKLTEITPQATTTFNGTFKIDNTPPDITAGLREADHTPNDASASIYPNPTLQGTTEPNREVIVLINNKRFTTTSDEQGNWSLELRGAELQTDQSYEYTVIASDGAGNTGRLTGTISNGHALPPTTNFGAHPDYLDGSPSVSTPNTVFYNSTPPVIIGRGNPGDTVTIYRPNASSYSTVVNNDGRWQITMPADLFPDTTPEGGYYSYTLSVTNGYGLTTEYPIRITLDSMPPQLNGGLDSNSDSGIQGDSLTNNPRPTLSGRTEAGLKVSIVIAGSTYSVNANSAGDWRFTVPRDLRDGPYDYTITTVDKAGNTATPVSGTITVDTASVVLTGGLDTTADPNIADGWSSTNNQTLKGMTSPGATVTVTINGTVHAATVSANGEWSLNLANLANDNYSYTVTASNPAGTTSTINGHFTIDNTPPTTTVMLNTATDSGTLGDFITNVDRPVFIGQTKPGATVTLTLNGQSYTATADREGNWQITLPTSLTHGAYSYTVNVTDLAQNTSAPQQGNLHIFQNNTLAPVTSVSLDADSDSGTAGDAITHNKTPNFSGTAPAGITVVLTIGGRSYSTVADNHGNWKLAITNPLSDGTHNYTVILKDIAGNQSAPTAGQVTIDSVSALRLNGIDPDTDSGTPGDNITDNPTPTLIGSAEPNAAISLAINGNRYSTTADANGQWSLPVTDTLADGIYSYTVTATDIAGNTKLVTSTLTIDTTPPSQLTGGLDSSSETGAPGSQISNNARPTFSGTTESGATVTLSISGREFTAVAGVNGEWTLTLPPIIGVLTDGNHPYTITVRDSSGNPSGLTLTGEVTIQTTPPSANAGLQAGSDSGIIGDQITNQAHPILSGQTTPGSTIVMVFNDVTYPVSVNALGYWSFQIPNALAEGEYRYQVIATDNAGNTALYDGQFTVDTTPPATPPTVELGAMSDSGVVGDNITNVKTPTFSGTAASNTTVVLTINGMSYSTLAGDDGAWSITLPLSQALAEGLHDYSVVAKDAAGNTSTATTGSVTIMTTPPAMPSGELSSDTDTGPGDNITSITVPKFIGKADANTTVILTINSRVYEIPVGNDGAWSFTLPSEDALRDGTYTYTLQSKDAIGNLSSALTDTITIDTTPPSAPSAALAAEYDSGVTGDNITNITTPKFVGHTEPGATVTLTINNKDYAFPATADGSWAFTLPASDALSTGTYSYQVAVKDSAGNSSPSTTGTITIDTTPPDTPRGGLALDTDSGTTGDNITSTPLPTFSGTATPNTLVLLTINHKVYEITVDTQGAWRFTLPAADALTDQRYTYTLQGKDAIGNTSAILNGALTIDTRAPSTTGGLDQASDSGTLGDSLTHTTTPTFSGSTEANATITLTLNSQSYKFQANAAGAWSFTLPSQDALPDGAYPYTLQVSDAAGNTSSPLTGSVTIDSTPPALPSVALDASTDSGISGDQITNLAVPKFVGMTEADATIQLTINSHTYDIQAQANGAWDFTLPSGVLSDGIHKYTVQAIDKAGNLSKIVEQWITIDTTAPIIPTAELASSSATGSAGDKTTSATLPSFTGASEADVEITLRIDNQDYVTRTDSSGNWTITVSHPLSAQTYDYTVTAKDAAGNTSQLSETLTIVDSTPTPPLFGAAANANAVHDSSATGDDAAASPDNAPQPSLSVPLSSPPDAVANAEADAADSRTLLNGSSTANPSDDQTSHSVLATLLSDAANSASAADGITPLNDAATANNSNDTLAIVDRAPATPPFIAASSSSALDNIAALSDIAMNTISATPEEEHATL